MSIEHISDTARWVAVYRARESERADAIFRDPYARRLNRGMRMMWIWRSMPIFSSAKRCEEYRRFSGMVLLERTTPSRSGALNE